MSPYTHQMTASQTSPGTSTHGLWKLTPPSPNPTQSKAGFVPAANSLQVTDGHPGDCPCATHIDQVLLEAFPQVLNECSFAGEVFQQDKVLHPDTVPRRQSALHGQPDAVGSQSLQPKAQGRWDSCGFAGSSPSPQEPQLPMDIKIIPLLLLETVITNTSSVVCSNCFEGRQVSIREKLFLYFQ